MKTLKFFARVSGTLAVTALLLLICLAAVTYAGGVLQPPSSPWQTGAWILASVVVAAASAVRRVPARRAAAGHLPEASRFGAADLLPTLYLVGAAICFLTPSWRATGVEVVVADRADALLESVPRTTSEEVAGVITLRAAVADRVLTMREPKKIGGPDRFGRLGGGGRAAEFAVAGAEFRWPLPPGEVWVQTAYPDRLPAPFSDSSDDPAFRLDEVLSPVPPPGDGGAAGDAGWKEYVIFLSGAAGYDPRGEDFPTVAIPSASVSGATDHFISGKPEDSRSYPIAFARDSSPDENRRLIEYAWVSYDASHRPTLHCGGGQEEPFDVLGEGGRRGIPGGVLRRYVSDWRAVEYASPRTAALPLGGHFWDGARLSPVAAARYDVPRGSDGNAVWLLLVPWFLALCRLLL